ncbi:NADPH-dependent 7-cyano-7-deazaguanine reductase QueF [Parachlamydia sp. AcF125]|uniref:NADPH-dependent 7-cyano-7-deazaguanine reductase QueF n=1 Tax=Parachlamydia sp. AcF125 TaxID=2795736 RepID=UPI001BCA2AD7|nr:NADPH-dependent 7-cyano-7-deazaguanine reductase QueF [Parachlamydia sp. AcF125]MBS4167385.1 NADPH-dependent 7-cyano-7-deazaguanine reductase [Parachlamydia sp. AcF125]
MLDQSPLGKQTKYVTLYSPGLLFAIPRTLARSKIGLSTLPFTGMDIWNSYEVSWLDEKGKPQIAFGEFHFPYDTPNIIESKSFKLYLNSFNQTKVRSLEKLQEILEQDLSNVSLGSVKVKLYSPSDFKKQSLHEFSGTCLDGLEIETDTYSVFPEFLSTAPQEEVEEAVYSELLKSNCLATGQPDWGTVLIRYVGKKIEHAGLLKYIISYRNHSGFHEDCVEKIFHDISTHCKPEKLTVYARYVRRGGLDINPFRSNFEVAPPNLRLNRQ